MAVGFDRFPAVARNPMHPFGRRGQHQDHCGHGQKGQREQDNLERTDLKAGHSSTVSAIPARSP